MARNITTPTTPNSVPGAPVVLDMTQLIETLLNYHLLSLELCMQITYVYYTEWMVFLDLVSNICTDNKYV